MRAFSRPGTEGRFCRSLTMGRGHAGAAFPAVGLGSPRTVRSSAIVRSAFRCLDIASGKEAAPGASQPRGIFGWNRRNARRGATHDLVSFDLVSFGLLGWVRVDAARHTQAPPGTKPNPTHRSPLSPTGGLAKIIRTYWLAGRREDREHAIIRGAAPTDTEPAGGCVGHWRGPTTKVLPNGPVTRNAALRARRRRRTPDGDNQRLSANPIRSFPERCHRILDGRARPALAA
jgi:hypothetical protein